MRSRFPFRTLLALLLVAAAAGHVVYHYLPRERPGVPSPASPAGRLLTSDRYPIALWIPHPHQNLSVLRSLVGIDGDGVEAVARLAGLPSPRVPGFGPLAVPPSSALAVASDETGERYAVAAEVYPAFAAFARLAGRLAENPWLSGGEVYRDGRRSEVAWRGDLWTVASPELPALEPSPEPAAEEGEPALAMIEVRQAVHPLPAGRYRLVRRGEALELLAGRPDAGHPPDGSAFAGLNLAELGVFLLAVAGPVEPLGEPTRALVGFTAAGDDSTDLPRLAALGEPGGELWELPGESILELAGRRPHRAEAAGWSVAALDAASLEGAVRLAPRLESVRRDADGGRLVWGLWLDLDAGLREVARIVRILEAVPLVPRRQLERWRDVETVLGPLAERHTRLTITVTEEPRAFRLRLEPSEGG
jgi:hypothetical protein